ncbi:MAG TPA: helix-turn-helix domain-containing protein [Devosiaceae bacterium]|jgi:AraC family transcriptional activator of pobA
MDVWRIVLYYPNMDAIPTYGLYGEVLGVRQHDWLHWETIQSRSRLHGYRIAPHRHEQFFQVLHLTGGWGRVTLDGAVHELAQSAVAVVPAVTVHGYEFSDDVQGIVVTMMERDLGGKGLALPDAMVIQSGTEIIGECLGRLIEEADRPGPGHDLAMHAHLSLLQIALHRAGQQPTPANGEPERARLHAQAFRRLVDQRFRQTRRIADYASEIGVSQTHLNRICRQALGSSALEVIERRIILEVRRQLLFSGLSIKQIGAELGYDDPAYFSRFVTRALGEAPGVFRRRMQAAQPQVANLG